MSSTHHSVTKQPVGACIRHSTSRTTYHSGNKYNSPSVSLPFPFRGRPRPPCAHWEVAVQRSASACRPVIYESDLWAGGNGKHRGVDAARIKVWGINLAPVNLHWKTHNGSVRDIFIKLKYVINHLHCFNIFLNTSRAK